MLSMSLLGGLVVLAVLVVLVRPGWKVVGTATWQRLGCLVVPGRRMDWCGGLPGCCALQVSDEVVIIGFRGSGHHYV